MGRLSTTECTYLPTYLRLFLLSCVHNCFRDLECARPRALRDIKKQFISQDKHRCN